MTKETEVPSGDENSNTENDSGRVNHEASSQTGNESSSDFVARETYLKSLNQEKNVRNRLRTTEEELQKLRDENKKFVEEKLYSEGEKDKLLEIRTKERDEYRNKYENLSTDVVEGEKISAFLDKLPGRLANKEYYNFIPTKDIVIDPTTGEIDESSLTEAVNQFSKKHSMLITPLNGRKLPNDAANSASTDLSYEAWLKLPYAEKMKNFNKVKRE